MLRGISLLKRLRQIDGFTWASIIVAANFFAILFLKIAAPWRGTPLVVVLLLFTFLVLLFFWRPGVIIATVLFIAFFLAGPIGWWGRPLGLLLLFILLAVLFSRRWGFAQVIFNLVRK
jgi:hypothetical protein